MYIRRNGASQVGSLSLTNNTSCISMYIVHLCLVHVLCIHVHTFQKCSIQCTCMYYIHVHCILCLFRLTTQSGIAVSVVLVNKEPLFFEYDDILFPTGEVYYRHGQNTYMYVLCTCTCTHVTHVHVYLVHLRGDDL